MRACDCGVRRGASGRASERGAAIDFTKRRGGCSSSGSRFVRKFLKLSRGGGGGGGERTSLPPSCLSLSVLGSLRAHGSEGQDGREACGPDSPRQRRVVDAFSW